MIFLVVGSQKFSFDRLIREVDRLIECDVIKDEVFAQIGSSQYVPKHMRYECFLDKETFDSYIAQCDLLITHAGEGSIMTGLLRGKIVIAVPRYVKFGEHVSDHQLQIARALEKQGYIVNVEDIQSLEGIMTRMNTIQLRPYESGKQTIIHTLFDFIGE